MYDYTWNRNIIWSPLHTAARNGHIEIVKLLLDEGANIDAVTRPLSAIPGRTVKQCLGLRDD